MIYWKWRFSSLIYLLQMVMFQFAMLVNHVYHKFPSALFMYGQAMTNRAESWLLLEKQRLPWEYMEYAIYK